MALDPRISLAAQAPDVMGAVNQGLMSAQRLQQIQQTQQQAPLQNRLLTAQAEAQELETQGVKDLTEARSLIAGIQKSRRDLQAGGRSAEKAGLYTRKGEIVGREVPGDPVHTDAAIRNVEESEAAGEPEESYNERELAALDAEEEALYQMYPELRPELGFAEKEKIKKELGLSETKFKQVRELRKDAEDVSKDFNKVKGAYNRVQAVFETNEEAAKMQSAVSSQNPDAAAVLGSTEAFGDMALIFNYMKVLDPGSTVREGEFANAQNTAGIPDQVLNLRDQIISGNRLQPNQREGIRNQVDGLYTAAQNQNNKDLSRIKKQAETNELPLDQIIEMQEEDAPVEIQTVTTQKQYDSLPSGAIFIEDGVKYKKP